MTARRLSGRTMRRHALHLVNVAKYDATGRAAVVAIPITGRMIADSWARTLAYHAGDRDGADVRGARRRLSL